MVFRDQQLEPNELRELVRHFGPLFHHHADEGVHYVPDIPEVLEIRKEPNDERLFGGGCWHADVTFRKPAGYVSVLHAQIIPTLGGDTVFSSTIAAFNGLSGGMQSLLRKLDAVHSYDGPGKPDHKTQCATHPVVRQHPCTNSEGIYLYKMFATRFDGMTADTCAAPSTLVGCVGAGGKWSCGTIGFHYTTPSMISRDNDALYCDARPSRPNI